MLLASHHDVFSLRKELCPGFQPDIDESLFARYLNFTASRAQAENGSWLRMEDEEVQEACVGTFGRSSTDRCEAFYEGAKSGGSERVTKVLQACMDMEGVIRMQNLVPVKTRVLFLQRDPADVLWSAYNFWQNQMDAPETVINKDWSMPWTNKLNFRSPVHFDELVKSEGRLAGSIGNWSNYLQVPQMHQLREAFGTDGVLFLRSEDMHLRDTVQKICDFVGLDIDGIAPGLIDARTNSQGSFDTRGIGVVDRSESEGQGQEDEKLGRYEVSGFEPMLCETRETIYDQARSACIEFDEKFGLHYPECLGMAPACP